MSSSGTWLISQWTDPADSDAGIAWARTTFDALTPHMAERAYTNYLPADDHGRVRQAYGVNYERFVELSAATTRTTCSTSTRTSPRREVTGSACAQRSEAPIRSSSTAVSCS